MMKRLLFIFALACIWAGSARAQDFNKSYNFVFIGKQGPGTSFASTGVNTFAIFWNPEGQVASCSVRVDSSADGVSWGSGDLIGSQNCATAGFVAATALATGKNFVRINVTALSSPGNAGSGNASLNVTLKGWGGSSNSSSSGAGVSPLSYGATWDVKYVPDCAWTSGTSTVTCSSGDANFTAADVGKIMFGVRSTAQVNPSALTNALDFAQGTITAFNSATSVTVSTTAGATCPDGSHPNCNFAWGTQDDTTAIINAQAAAWNSGNACKALQLPSGAAFISSAVLNGPIGQACGSNSASAAFSDLTSAGPAVYGQGQMATVLVPLPIFNFASCTAGSGSACIGAAPNLQAHDFGINGMQNPVGGTHANVLFESYGANGGGNCDGGATIWNMALSGWALTATSSIGFQAGVQSCNDPMHYNDNVMLFGSQTCQFFPQNTLTVYSFMCFGGNSLVVGITGGAFAGSPHQFNSYGGAYYTLLATGGQLMRTTGTASIINSNGDHIAMPNASAIQYALIRTDNASAITFTNDQIVLPTTTAATTVLAFLNNGGANVHFRNSTVTATGTNNQLFNTGATDKVFDDCGNTFANGTVANAIGGGFFGNCSVTGTALTAGAIVPSANWGTSAAVSAPFGATTDIGFTLTNGSAAVGASPTLTYTFPTPYLVRPNYCIIQQTGGTQAQIVNEWSVGTPTTTSVVFTYNATPTVNLTEFIAVSCK